MKKKVLKYILLVVIIVILCFTALLVRKYMILAKLDKMASNYNDTKDSIYGKVLTTGENQNNVISELFIKGDVRKYVVDVGDTRKMTQYIYTNEVKSYAENGDKKVMSVNADVNAVAGMTLVASIPNYTHDTSVKSRIISALKTSIKSAELDGKKCYELSGMNSPLFLYTMNSVGISLYVEKDTGLPVKLVETIDEDGIITHNIMEYEFKFDTVTDEDMTEPDASEYTVQENK